MAGNRANPVRDYLTGMKQGHSPECQRAQVSVDCSWAFMPLMKGLPEFFPATEDEDPLDEDPLVPLPGAAGALSAFPKPM